MKGLLKNYLRALFLLLMLVCGFGTQVQAEEVGETEEEVDYTCGKNATWSFDKDSKTLTISGSGNVISNSAWWSLNPKKLVVAEGITTLDNYCFSSMKFTDVKLPESLKKLGRGAFAYNSKLEEIKIPSNVVRIDASAFSSCEELTEISLPDSVKTVKEYCFSSCGKLRNVRLPSGLKRIAPNVFQSCDDLQEITLPSGIQSIGRYAFAYCSALKKVTLPEGVKSIGRYAFTYCANLEKVTLPEGLESIGGRVFYGSGLTAIVVPKSVEKLAKAAFYQCKNLRTAQIKARLEKLPDNLFRDCESLKKVSFSDDTRTVGEYAFAGCEKLEKANFKGKLEVIQYKAFAKTGFKSIRLEGNLRHVDYRAFQQCARLKKVYVGKEIKQLYRNTFSGCSALKAYTVSEENTRYSSQDGSLLNKSGKTLFACPSGQKGVYVVPESVKTISSSAFVSCAGIKEYRLASEKGKYTEQKGILYCNGGKTLFACPPGKEGKIKIPSTVTRIRRNAFQNSRADKIVLPKNLKEMEYCAFRNCRNLQGITIPGSVKVISNAVFWSCQELRRVTLNMGTKKIARNAFFGCTKLRKVKLPASVEKIHSTSFANVTYKAVFYCTRGSYAMDFVYRKRFSYRLI